MIVNLKRVFHCFLAATLLTACLGSSAVADNLLTNSDFKLSKPGEDDFGWALDLDEDQKSEALVVEGRQPGTTAICLRHDEVGTSYISQEIKVQPWRWYVAQMWVNSEQMAGFGFAPVIDLEGGRKISGGRFHFDAFEWPKKGWRRRQVVAHSADRDTITLKMGGDGWSGDLLFCDLVVRECSLVEAAAYYPSVHHRHPALYGPQPSTDTNQNAYAFQMGDVCRVVPGFKNLLRLGVQMREETPNGRISLALPPGIRFFRHEDEKITPEVSEMPNGFQRVEFPQGSVKLLVDSDLEAGEDAVGYVHCEWKGGFQVPVPVRFQGAAKPDVEAPQRAMVTLVIHAATLKQWDGDEVAMVGDFKRFGFNQLEYWGGSPLALYKAGINASTAALGTFYFDPKTNPEAAALSIDGKPSGNLMSPSYRGPALQPRIDVVKSFGEVTSNLMLDDEFYGMSGGSPGICFHPHTIDRWHQWVAEKRPELAGVDPKVFGRRPHKYRKHYDAWLDFRCDLVAERYAILRDAFHEAVEASGVKTTDRVMLGAYIDDNPLVGLNSNKALAPVLDYVANMVYKDGAGIREEVARLAPVTGKKLVIATAPGYQISPPGDARSQVLEAVMGGSQGVIIWGYFMGMTAGHLVDISDAVKMFGPVEEVVLDGTIQDGYTCETDSVNLLARKQGDVQVLLVSDYSPRPHSAIVTVPGDAKLEVTDLFTDQVIASLDSENRTFSVPLRRNFAARLYRLQPPK